MSDLIEDFLARARARLDKEVDPIWQDFSQDADGDHRDHADLIPFLPGADRLKAAAVLMCVYEEDGPQVVLTRRRDDLRAHKGQIAFPGGKAEPEDLTPASTALREAEEEIGLNPAHVELLGFGPIYQSLTGYRIAPVVGLLREPQIFVPQEAEVAEIFSVPLEHLLDGSRYKRHETIWQGRPRSYDAIPYKDRYIWGITAAILRRVRTRLYDD